MKNSTVDLPQTYLELSAFRNEDIYPADMNWEGIVTDFFPATFPALVQRLSDITGAFYGVMLKQAGEMHGADQIDALSAATLYDIGVKTATRNMQAKPGLQKNIPDLFKVLISAVFTSSPEFRFEVLEVNERRGEMKVKGVDRYHKIAKALDMADQLQWPVILPFVKGVRDGMGLNCTVSMERLQLNDSSECLYELIVTDVQG